MINSALVEGKVLQTFTEKESDKELLYGFFVIEQSYDYLANGNRYPMVNKLKVHAGGNLAESCRKHLKKNMMVRAVCKLAQPSEDMDKIDLIADHIEIRS